MPNNLRPDFVAPHFHAPTDVQGLDVALFPPTETAVGVAVGPTRASAVLGLLTDMDVSVTPPDDIFPLWEATVTFTGTFSNDTAGERVTVAVYQDGSLIAGSRRRGTSYQINGQFELAERVTAIIPAGSATQFQIFWAASAGTGTAVDVERRLDVTLRPYTA